jgi:hypothetical protein
MRCYQETVGIHFSERMDYPVGPVCVWAAVASNVEHWSVADLYKFTGELLRLLYLHGCCDET